MPKRFAVSLFALVLLGGGNILHAAGTVNINTATVEELDTIDSVGPTIAQRIMDERPFASLDDLLRVKGIGEKTLEKIKAQGLASVEESLGAQSSEPITLNIEKAADEPKTYPLNVSIDAVLPNPEGADETEEWIRLYNSNTSPADISSFTLKDTAGSSATYTFPKDTRIAAQGTLTLNRTQTHILLNNEGDGVELHDPAGSLVSSVSFGKAPLGGIYRKSAGGWQWTNIKPALSKTTKPAKKNTVSPAAASLSAAPVIVEEEIGPDPHSWLLFYLALGLLGGGAIAYILKILFFKPKQDDHVRT